MALTYLDFKLTEDFRKRDRLDPDKQKQFLEALLKEESLSRFTEETIEKVFYYVFYVYKTSKDLKIENLAGECLSKFFRPKSLV